MVSCILSASRSSKHTQILCVGIFRSIALFISIINWWIRWTNMPILLMRNLKLSVLFNVSTLRCLCLNMSFGLSSGLLCIPLPLPLSEECKVVTWKLMGEESFKWVVSIFKVAKKRRISEERLCLFVCLTIQFLPVFEK